MTSTPTTETADQATRPAGSTATGSLTGQPGRYLLSARTNHLVSDSRYGPSEAITAGELLVAALASCALSNVTLHGTELGTNITDARVEVASERDPDDETRYRAITITVDIPHAPRPQAQEVVTRFTATCPIYNTISRGGPISVALRTTA
jgi:uncharacterized OsmC-like protein